MIFVFISALFLFALVSWICLYKRYVKSQQKYFKNVPGPKPNPIFGNMLDFAVPSYEFLNVIGRYMDQYGRIFKIYIGPLTSIIAVSDETFMEHILSSTKLIEKSDEYGYMMNWLGTGLLTSKGSTWKKRRRMITPAFHFSILDNFVDVFENVGSIFIKKLEEHIEEENFNIYPLISLCTLDIICESAMGISVSALSDGDSEYVRNVKSICAIITGRNFSPLDTRLYPLTINYYKEKLALKVLHSHTDLVIEKKMEDLKKSNDTEEVDSMGIKKKWAFLDLLLKGTIDGKPLSKTDIREEVDTFMFEGHDTTSSAIAFALYSLAQQPLIQQKAVEEQMQLFSDIKNAKATISDLQNMNYLELVIKETLRLYPSVPLFARKVSEDFVWGDSIYAKGTTLIMFPYFSQRNPKYYTNPLEFIPERFLEIDGKHPYRYIPFSAGPRNCIGQKFAMLEMKSTISRVLRNFELLPAKENHAMKLAPELILVSKNGVRLTLKKRN